MGGEMICDNCKKEFTLGMKSTAIIHGKEVDSIQFCYKCHMVKTEEAMEVARRYGDQVRKALLKDFSETKQ